MRSAFHALALTLAAPLLGACGVMEEKDRRDFDRLIFEGAPPDRPRDAARERFEADAAKPAVGLLDCFRMAVYRSETLSLQGEELARMRLRVRQAFGEALPAVSFAGSYTRQDHRGIAAGSSLSIFNLSERTQYQFTLRHTLFRGLESVYEIRRRAALAGALEERLRQARLLLQAEVAEAFFAVLALRRENETMTDSVRLAEERLAELVERARAGISRRSELLSQEAELAQARADLERLRGQLAVAGDAVRFLTGLPEGRELEDRMPEPAPPGPLEEAVARAIASRPDLRAQRAEAVAAAEGVGVARAGIFPRINLDANSYTHREGVSKDIDWDVVLSFEVPILEGGVTQARIREARSEIRSAELREQRLRREIELEVGRTWSDIRAFSAEWTALETAVAAAAENYDLVQAEYRRGIAGNVEVLAAFAQLQRARLDRDRARYQAKRSRTLLDLQTGVEPREDAP